MSTQSPVVHVAVAVIVNAARARVLVSKRPQHVHQGGLWEFPGGKVEAGESVETALGRELQEELGISPRQSRPLIRIRHHYLDKSVLLDVWRVTEFDGEPRGREGQPVEWLPLSAMSERDFPAANGPILAAASLPDRYLITPDFSGAAEAYLGALEASLQSGVRLVQLRLREWRDQALIKRIVRQVHQVGGKLLINGELEQARAVGADGIHLNSQRLMAWEKRPVPGSYLVAASCHDPAQLRRAEQVGCDFALLSPVAATRSHPDSEPLGWSRFQQWVDETTLPVYALGGMQVGDLDQAFRHGAQGIAAISGLWNSA